MSEVPLYLGSLAGLGVFLVESGWIRTDLRMALDSYKLGFVQT